MENALKWAVALVVLMAGQLNAKQAVSLADLAGATVTIHDVNGNYLVQGIDKGGLGEFMIDRTPDAAKATKFVITKDVNGNYFFAAGQTFLAIFNGGGRARLWKNNKSPFTVLSAAPAATAGQFLLSKTDHNGSTVAYLLMDVNTNHVISTSDAAAATPLIFEIQ